MIEWIPVTGSTRIVAEAYSEETETILVRFPNGVEWYYSACPRFVWEKFTAPGPVARSIHRTRAEPQAAWVLAGLAGL